jgi:hypothetical protein
MRMRIYYLIIAGLFLLTGLFEILLVFTKNEKLIKFRPKLPIPKPIIVITSLVLLAYGGYYINIALTRY